MVTLGLTFFGLRHKCASLWPFWF